MLLGTIAGVSFSIALACDESKAAFEQAARTVLIKLKSGNTFALSYFDASKFLYKVVLQSSAFLVFLELAATHPSAAAATTNNNNIIMKQLVQD